MRSVGSEMEGMGPSLREPEYDTVHMGRVSGGLWILAAAMGFVGALLPGAVHGQLVWVFVLSAAVLAYGLASVTGLIPWERASLRTMAIGTVMTIPVAGVALYLTGAAVSYIQPLLICSLLYIAFFFPPRWAWPLTVELLAVAALPFVYDDRAVATAFPSRYVALAAGFLAVTGVTLRLKQRLVEAERSQREMANRDFLTGIPNRRAFDLELQEALAAVDGSAARRGGDSGRLALLILDLDDFKAINDAHGHLVGDAVLSDTAHRAGEVLRSTDMLARIGGDEFAVIAPGCDAAAARSLANRLSSAVATSDPRSTVPTPRVSVGWSAFPDDGATPVELMRAADARLLHLKRSAWGLSVVPPQELPRSGLERDDRQATDEAAG